MQSKANSRSLDDERFGGFTTFYQESVWHAGQTDTQLGCQTLIVQSDHVGNRLLHQ